MASLGEGGLTTARLLSLIWGMHTKIKEVYGLPRMAGAQSPAPNPSAHNHLFYPSIFRNPL